MDAVDQSIRHPGRPSTRTEQEKDTQFLGTHLPKEVHRRLYRVKAAYEYQTGAFYGLGKLLAKVIDLGLAQLESTLITPESSASC